MKILVTTQLSPHRYKTPEGYLVCQDCILARTGKQEYLMSEIYPQYNGVDEIIQVNRKAEQVFDPLTLASFEDKPVTVEHPEVNVNASNYNELAVGHTRNIRKSTAEGQDVMIGDLVITDAEIIKDIENGIRTELSCGYDCDITEGDNPEQINIRGNHVALCEQGRAGIARIIDSAILKDIKPKKDESKEDFILRFMSETKEEYPDEKQRFAVANSYWERQNVKDSCIKDDYMSFLANYGFDWFMGKGDYEYWYYKDRDDIDGFNKAVENIRKQYPEFIISSGTSSGRPLIYVQNSKYGVKDSIKDSQSQEIGQAWIDLERKNPGIGDIAEDFYKTDTYQNWDMKNSMDIIFSKEMFDKFVIFYEGKTGKKFVLPNYTTNFLDSKINDYRNTFYLPNHGFDWLKGYGNYEYWFYKNKDDIKGFNEAIEKIKREYPQLIVNFSTSGNLPLILIDISKYDIKNKTNDANFAFLNSGYNNSEELSGYNKLRKKYTKDSVDKYVIYKENGKYRGTSESNYNAKIRNAFKITNFNDFETIEQIIDYLLKYTKLERQDIITIGDPSGISDEAIEKDFYKEATKDFISKYKKIKKDLDNIDPEDISSDVNKKYVKAQIKTAHGLLNKIDRFSNKLTDSSKK